MTVTLPVGAYYRLRYLQQLAETAAASAEVAALRAAAQAQQAQQQFLSALAQAAYVHDFDPSTPYRWDDTRTALVADDAPSQADPQ